MTGSQKKDLPMNASMTSLLTLNLVIAFAAAYPASAESPVTVPSAGKGFGLTKEVLTKEAVAQIQAVQTALTGYRQTTGRFPSTELGLAALVASGNSGDPGFKQTKEALQSVPLDPWGRPYAYRATENTMTLASQGQDPDVAEDDIVVIETVALAGKAAPMLEQVIPVVGLLRSVKESDSTRFQQCWSKAMAERMGLNDESAERMIERYRGGFAKVFGDYALEEFSFSFTGTATVGAVTVQFRNQAVPPLLVIKSGGVWKLGEK
jgi:type II secretion system protein G